MSNSNLAWRRTKNNSINKSPISRAPLVNSKTRWKTWSRMLRCRSSKCNWLKAEMSNWWKKSRRSQNKLASCWSITKNRLSCRKRLIDCCIVIFPRKTTPSTRHWHPSSTPTQKVKKWKSCSYASPKAFTNSDKGKCTSRSRRAVTYLSRSVAGTWASRIS